MFTFIKKIIKWSLISVAGLTALFVALFVWFVVDEIALQADARAPEVKTVAKVQVPVETAKHTACRLKLHSENPYGGTYNGLDVLVWDTDAFGTYADGEVWVGYNRKVGDKVFYNLSKIC